MRPIDRRGGYLLALVGGKGVGYAGYRFSSNRRTLHLTGAGVLPAYRPRGIYSSLVRERLKMGRRAGAELATSLAKRNTSFPILRRFGFGEYGSYEQLAAPVR